MGAAPPIVEELALCFRLSSRRKSLITFGFGFGKLLVKAFSIFIRIPAHRVFSFAILARRRFRFFAGALFGFGR